MRKKRQLYARHETQAEAIARLAPNEEMNPLGKASLPGVFWYMVKTRERCHRLGTGQ